jgi:hypothetical protein
MFGIMTFVRCFDSEIIEIDIAKYPKTMFEVAYNFKKRCDPCASKIMIDTQYPKKTMLQILAVCRGDRELYYYNHHDADLIEIINQFLPEYEPIIDAEDEDPDLFDEYVDEEQPIKKGANYQERMDEDTKERLYDEWERANDRLARLGMCDQKLFGWLN